MGSTGVLRTLQPRAFRSLNRVDPLDSVSNLYIYRTLLNQSKYKTGSLHPLIPHLLLHGYVHWIKQLVCMPVTVHTKITTLGDIGAWKTCEANEYAEISKIWPQYTLNCSAMAIFVTNATFLAMPVDHTYLLGHVLFPHANNQWRI